MKLLHVLGWLEPHPAPLPLRDALGPLTPPWPLLGSAYQADDEADDDSADAMAEPAVAAPPRLAVYHTLG